MLDYRMDTFLSLCETKSYTKTAELLHLTQPSVTQHIKYLEQIYQCQLFQYDGKQVNMTDAGQYLRDKMRMQFAQETEIRKHLSHLQKGEQLRIGISPTAAMSPVMGKLCECIGADELGRISVPMMESKTLMQQVLTCELDGAVLEGEVKERLLSGTELFREKIIAVSDRKTAERLYGCTWNQLLKQTLFLQKAGTGIRSLISHSLGSRGFSIYDFAQLIEVNSFVVMKEFLRQGKGVAFVFESTVQKERDREELGRVYIDTLSSIYGTIQFVCLREREEEERLRTMREAMYLGTSTS